MKFSSVREYSPVFSCFVMIVSPYFPPFLVITPPMLYTAISFFFVVSQFIFRISIDGGKGGGFKTSACT